MRVLIVTERIDDRRVALTREAVAFWNRTFEELGLEPAFASTVAVSSPAGRRALENYAWLISRSAGRLAPGIPGPPPPRELLDLDADVVVLLSVQELMPFAWPYAPRPAHHSDDASSGAAGTEPVEPDAEATRPAHLVALPADPATSPVQLGNVVAHELGHVLGLAHDRGDETSLMCQPCRGLERAAGSSYRPLSEAALARLRERYGSR